MKQFFVMACIFTHFSCYGASLEDEGSSSESDTPEFSPMPALRKRVVALSTAEQREKELSHEVTQLPISMDSDGEWAQRAMLVRMQQIEKDEDDDKQTCNFWVNYALKVMAVAKTKDRVKLNCALRRYFESPLEEHDEDLMMGLLRIDFKDAKIVADFEEDSLRYFLELQQSNSWVVDTITDFIFHSIGNKFLDAVSKITQYDTLHFKLNEDKMTTFKGHLLPFLFQLGSNITTLTLSLDKCFDNVDRLVEIISTLRFCESLTITFECHERDSCYGHAGRILEALEQHKTMHTIYLENIRACTFSQYIYDGSRVEDMGNKSYNIKKAPLEPLA